MIGASTESRILIVSEASGELLTIRDVLLRDFNNVVTSPEGIYAIEAFQSTLPNVLILAFSNLSQSETQYLAIWRAAKEALHPHRAVVLCRTADVRQAYLLCRKGVFDDYVQYWPMSLDPMRLAMAVDLACRGLESDQAEEKYRMLLNPATQAPEKLISSDVTVNLRSPKLLKRAAPETLQGNQRGVGLAPRSGEFANRTADLCQRTILIVDDDPFQRSALASILGDQGFNLMFASNGVEALESMQTTRPDVILLDVVMPEMDGAETIRRVKAQVQFSDIPVLMMAGDSRGITVKTTISAGARDFLVKPIVASVLIDKLRRALFV